MAYKKRNKKYKMFIIIIWILCGLIGMAIGIKKGYHPVTALLRGLLLGILSPLLLRLKLKNVLNVARVLKKAKVCRYCGYRFE